MEVLQNLALAFASPRVFSPEREISDGTERTGAIIKKKKVEIVPQKEVNRHFGRHKRQLYLTFRSFGSRLDALLGGVWAIPMADDRPAKLEAALKKIDADWASSKADFIALYPSLIEKQIAENPQDAATIRALAPSVSDIDATIRLAWGVVNVGESNLIVQKGLEQEIDGLPAQAAYEIALELKERVSCTNGKYTRASITALLDVARKAEGFGFLSPALAAVRPAVERLSASLPASATAFEGADALTIGAMIGFLSDPVRVIAEGRRIEESVFAAPSSDDLFQQSAQQAPMAVNSLEIAAAGQRDSAIITEALW